MPRILNQERTQTIDELLRRMEETLRPSPTSPEAPPTPNAGMVGSAPTPNEGVAISGSSERWIPLPFTENVQIRTAVPAPSSFARTFTISEASVRGMVRNKPKPDLPDGHPIFNLVELAKDLGITAYQFAAYEYKSGDKNYYPSNKELVKTLKVLTTDNLVQNYIDYVNSPDSGWGEIAVQSTVFVGKDKYHLPLIDFKEANLRVIEEALDYSSYILKAVRDDFKIYFSGNSYHAYGQFLLSEDEAFPEYSSRLLLVNHPNSENSIVDSRWVGHSQLKGRYSLRLTNNGKPTIPTLVK